MILIADSGSTKTNWLYVNGLERKKVSGKGLNLHYQALETVARELFRIHQELGDVSIESICFYGSGVSNSEMTHKMRELLRDTFPGVGKMEIASDLLGAAKALFANQSGVACILGTGTATGLFEKGNIVEQVPSLGFWLGDEGSGSYLGKELVKAYLRKEMGKELTGKFELRFGQFERHAVFHEMRQTPLPNQYFATFTPFLSEHAKHAFVRELLGQSFSLFVEKNLLQYPIKSDETIGLVGSVGFYFQDILRQVIARYLDNELKFLRDPIDSLGDFHLNGTHKPYT